LHIFCQQCIINKTLAPIIFADDTSILFTHSNLIEFNRSISIVFTTLNKWLGANQLSLNFKKSNYVHFTTKRNMSVNLQIGFNNNFITNSFYTKFLGVTMNNTLSWNNHIELLVKKISKTCYIIRNAKTYISAPSLKMIYYAFFHSIMSYGIIFWGNSWYSSIIFRLQKKVLRIMEGSGNRVSCRSENYSLYTRQRNNLYLPQANLTTYQKGAYYSGIKIFNNLSSEIKNVAGNQKKILNCFEKNFIHLFILHFGRIF